jgi:hypothetical protein
MTVFNETKIFLNLSIFPEKWDVQRNICADGSPIIITTMAEQTDEERYIIPGYIIS